MQQVLNKTYLLVCVFSFSLLVCLLGAFVLRSDFSFSSYSPKALEPHMKKELVTQSCPTLCRPRRLQPTRLLCLWDSPGKNTGVGCHALFYGIFLTLGVELRTPMLRADSLPSELPGKPQYTFTDLHSQLLFDSTLSMNHRGSAAYFPMQIN